MKSSLQHILILICFLAGCSIPNEPHPKNITRFLSVTNTPLAFIIPFELLYCDGYIESSITHHADSTNSHYENIASFFNHLGNEYLPSQPFAITVNGKMFFDTAKYSLSYKNYDSLDFFHPLIWQINGGKDVPSFLDSLSPPLKAEIIFPTPNLLNILPRQPFSIKYVVSGTDSIFVQLLIFSADTVISFYARRTAHLTNTGSFEVDQDLINILPHKASMHISIAAITEKQRLINGQSYIIRSGIIDNSSAHFTE